MILGGGALLANSICPRLIQQTYTHAGSTDFKHLFLLPAFIGLGAALVLLLFFHPPAPRPDDPGATSH